MKALVTVKFKDEEIKKLEDLGYEVVFKDERDISFSKDLEDVDIMVSSFAFDRLDIGLLPKLKWIQLLTVGINQIPLEKVLERNISITNNRGGYSIPIGEWIVLKILEMIKNSKEFYHKQNKKLWKEDLSLLELYGKTVGFLGTGSIASEAAKRLESFGVEIIGINSSARDVQHFHKTFSVDNINQVVSQCDFLVISAAYTDKTHHLLDETVLSHMKDGSYIVNIARGSIIDEEALINNLKSGKIRKAALDVFEEEPLNEDSPLWEMENVIITPHNSWASEMYHRRRFETTYNNMERFINNAPLNNLIDFNRGY